jgi:hypothetical protein
MTAGGGEELPAFMGEIRVPGTGAAAGAGAATGARAVPGNVALGPETLILSAEGAPARTIAYRDLSLIAINAGVGMLVAGDGPSAEQWLLERFGPAIGPLLATLRERRLRQRLADGFIEVPDEPALDLVEYRVPAMDGAPAEHGVAQLAFDPWGVTLAPLDERQPVRRARRADIAAVQHVPEIGGVRVTAAVNSFEILRQGAASARLRDRIAGLPAAAHTDAGAILAALLPDAPTGAVGGAATLLVDGRPASPAELGPAWPLLEAAVLGEPTFAASYQALRGRAGGATAMRWLAMAPVRPGSADPFKAWFIVALPGNLIALELVTEGAHATYCFRVMPRAAYAGGVDPAAATAAVSGISAALVDARFLREPIALPEAQLVTPKGIRYRLALRALPSLALARANFVARLVHASEESWAAALDDLIAWHGACRDDAAVWPGRAGQESEIEGTPG